MTEQSFNLDDFDSIQELQPTKIVRTEKTFSFNDVDEKGKPIILNAKRIELADLRFTKTLSDSQKKLPASRPLTHTQFIELTMEIADKKGVKVIEPEIWVAKSDSKFDTKHAFDRGIQDTLEAWFFDRLVCRIPIDVPDSPDYNPAIALAYNARGLTLSYGTNVRICSNMSIFGGKILKTYDEGMPFKRMMELFSAWMLEWAEHYEYDLGILQRMKSTFLGNTRDEIISLLGRLQLAASDRNLGGKVLAPLNESQVNTFAKEVIALRNSGKIDFDRSEEMTIYELYNIGTNILTHSTTNLEYKWEKVSDMGQFMEAEYLN